MSFLCGTRALKNARHLQSVAPHVLPKDEPPEGFYSLVPFDVLSRLHQMTDNELAAYPHLLEAARSLRSLQAEPRFSGLFNGALHFVQITFDVSGKETFVCDARHHDHDSVRHAGSRSDIELRLAVRRQQA